MFFGRHIPDTEMAPVGLARTASGNKKVNDDSFNRFAIGKGRFMQGKQNIGHLFDLNHNVIGIVGIHKGTGGNHVHLHGTDLFGREKVVFDHTETGNGCRTAGRFHDNGQAAFGVGRCVHDPDAVGDFPIGFNQTELTVLLNIFDEVGHISEI